MPLAEESLNISSASNDKVAGASGEFKRKRLSERILIDNSSLKKKKVMTENSVKSKH